MRPPCTQPGCDSEQHGRGLCNRHYKRLRRHGDPNYVPPKWGGNIPRSRSQLLEIIDQRTEVSVDGCWVWTGHRDRYGYGRLHSVIFDETLAYRVTYRLYVGPIPEGLELDHLCMNPPCVNPAHLEPVTHSVNLLRGFEAKRAREGDEGARLDLPSGQPHGKRSSYNLGCRCDDCRRVNREEARRDRARRAARLREDPSLAEHGSASTYRNWGCRCRPCTDAHQEQIRKRYEVSEVPA